MFRPQQAHFTNYSHNMSWKFFS